VAIVGFDLASSDVTSLIQMVMVAVGYAVDQPSSGVTLPA